MNDLYPKDYNIKSQNAGPNNVNNMSPAVMRYISISLAENNEKVSLAAIKQGGDYRIFGQAITSATTENDKWRMIQLVFGITPFFYFYHCQTGLCLARSNGQLVLTNVKNLQGVNMVSYQLQDSTNQIYGVWKLRGDERGMMLICPDSVTFDSSKNYCVSGTDVDIAINDQCATDSDCGDNGSCKNAADFCLTDSVKKIKPKLRTGSAAYSSSNSYNRFGSNPIAGKVWIKIGDKIGIDYNVSLDSPDQSVISQMICTGVVQTGIKNIDWYMLPQQDICNNKFGVPVRSGMSLGEFFSWNPETDVNSRYNRSRTPILPRFWDKTTQIVPEQSEYPKVAAITQNPDSVDCTSQYSSHEMFERTTTFNWQYIDIYAYFGGDQGYSPTEFKNITPVNMGVQGDLSSLGPGPLSGPVDDAFQANTTSLYTYLDGKRSGGLGGRVTIPPKWMIDSCHKNGVKCFGCIFFQEVYYGGKWGWWVQFTQDPALTSKRMMDIATYYGFDGWTFNFESGSPSTPLYKTYPGQVYKGINSFTGEPADDYWCNVIAGSKYEAWRHNDDSSSCGDDELWPCSCLSHTSSAQWPVPGYDPGATKSNECGTSGNKYTQGCNDGWSARDNLKKVFKNFRSLKKSTGSEVSLFAYDTIQVTSPFGVGISTVDPKLCPNGVDNTGQCFGNIDFWQDEEGPLVDYMYDMRSGFGGNEPSTSPLGVTSTFLLNNSKGAWPKDTGPKATGEICKRANHALLGKVCKTDDDCGANAMCQQMNPTSPDSYCIPTMYQDYGCNYGEPLKNTKAAADRAYDYFQAIQLEDIGGLNPTFPLTLNLLANYLSLMTQKGNPSGWDSALFCGIQSKNLARLGYSGSSGDCSNEENAKEPPMASINMYYIDTFWKWFGKFANIPGYPDKQSIIDWVVQNQLVYWTGARLLGSNNRIDVNTSADYWKGISHYVTERSVIQSYPFYTCFSLGAGMGFYIEGEKQNCPEWSNISLQSILPTWMWWPNDSDLNDASFIKITFNGEDAYQLSNSLQFTTTSLSTSWLRDNPPTATCDTTATKVDCNHPDQASCTASGCCWDNTANPDTNPWCFNKNGIGNAVSPVLPTKAIVSSTYRLFKTNLSLLKGCVLGVTFKISHVNSGIELSFGYSTKENPNTPFMFNISSSARGANWTTFKQNIDPKDSTIVCLWVSVKLPLDFMSTIQIGQICLLENDQINNIDDPGFQITDRYTTTETQAVSCTLEWIPVDGVEYYNIFMDSTLVGNVYQGYQGVNTLKDSKFSFKIENANEDSSFKISSSNALQSFRQSKSILGYVFKLVLFLLVCAGFYYLLTRFVPNIDSRIKIMGCIIGIILIIRIVQVCMPSNNKIQNFQIEPWQNCKQHCFNACFDDSRVKAWRWLVDISKRKKWPIKFSFFYNTMWMPRDYYVLKEWINLGHEVSCHLHSHISVCDHLLDEQFIIDNMQLCANLIRQLYDNPNKELVIAWPHGAFPLINPNCVDPANPACPRCKWAKLDGTDCGNCDLVKCDPECSEGWGDCDAGTCDTRTQQGGPMAGVPRASVFDAMEKIFIAGRQADTSTSTYFCNTWPLKEALTGVYPNSYWPYNLSPIWGFPYQIDASPGSCEDFKNSFNQSIGVKNGMVVFAGHTFNPTMGNGDGDHACDWGFASGSECSDPNNCQGTYKCPKEISDIAKSCWTNSPTSGISLYVNNNSSQGLSTMKMPPSMDTQLQPPANNDGCNECFDACWAPASGNCLVDFFDHVCKYGEMFWFATYTEIVQYTFNKAHSDLEYVKNGHYILKCPGRMYDCPITLSFGLKKLTRASVDGKSVDVECSSTCKYYIKFTPKSGTNHEIVIR